MKVNPIISFVVIANVIVAPVVIGVTVTHIFDLDGSFVFLMVLVAYLLIYIIAGLWWNYFRDEYKDWQSLKEKNQIKRSQHDKEMKQIKEELKEMQRRWDDRWDNF